ncbi:hypothetical protein N7495_000260 [Penicillium taxi]|uniref:uncharacterized protein n=1 Tax=Penicillium taxi TaxID=168475 RepID=UPI0025452369|nr:uncharacterized protein N7495_000260 [Penicillium taxi]KAJ5907578.1 hypothetical protein N7495_000260 [Penicillium taxi]
MAYRNTSVFSSPFALSSPPQSPRKRRHLLRESDETDGMISIEQYLYRGDPFRSTDMAVELPYPLILQSAPAEITTKVTSLYEQIRDILLDHGFPDASYLQAAVNTVTKLGYHWDPQTVLRLSFEYVGLEFVEPPTPPKRLGPARDAIVEFLKKNGVLIHVEIIFPDHAFMPCLFNLSPTDPTLSKYRPVQTWVLDYATRELPESWVSVSCFGVGRTKEKSTPSIVVLFQPAIVCG